MAIQINSALESQATKVALASWAARSNVRYGGEKQGGNPMANVPLVSVVDDDPSVRKALSRLCKAAGYRVELYGSSESFLNANVADRTDCLILDVHLPEKSGLDLQAELLAANKVCPLVFITAFEDERARCKAIDDGALAFLAKPLNVDRLLELIEQAVR